MHPVIRQMLDKHPDLAVCAGDVQRAFDLWSETYRRGGKTLICGNGGSAADTEHIVGELMKGMISTRHVPESTRSKLLEHLPEHGQYLAQNLQGALPTISLVSQTALMTALGNDVEADLLFAQQVYGYGKEGDVVVGISTSGNSANVIRALQVGRAMGLHTIGITGRDGGLMRSYCDATIRVPYDETADIQEHQLPVYHALCIMLEQTFFPE